MNCDSVTDETVTMPKKTYNMMITAGVILLLVVAFSAGYMIGNSSTTGLVTGNNQPNDNTPPVAQIKLTVGDAPVMGQANAPLTIIVFSDFSCPYCGGATGLNKDVVDYFKSQSPTWEPAVPGIINDYVKTGKAKLVFKYFPGHGSGSEAMKLALCANEQGKFWDVHDKFFANQNNITDVALLKTLVAQTGADMTKINECYASGKYTNRLMTDAAELPQDPKGQGTPTFFIGNDKGYVKVVGAQPYSVFKTAIDNALNS
ncbi:MAG: thioredoxin domain-containing protein [Candidatus Aenigmarchaeota archaeon]|nr:thioredoxin domain-containing protein [Candidatus Aenigmarchaeota archaeon]